MNTIITKKCSKCGEVQKISEYLPRSSRENQYSSWCRSCGKLHSKHKRMNYSPEKHQEEKDRAKRNYQENKAREFNNRIKNRYSITAEEYDTLFTSQNGKCAICGKAQEGVRLSIDHSHSNGKVRGLLCRRCNTAIGMLLEEESIFTKAMRYLRLYRDK